MDEQSPRPSSSRQSRVHACVHPGCTKSFGRRDYLERHAANHLESRPYPCPTCHKAFARADVLQRHISNHPSTSRSSRLDVKLSSSVPPSPASTPKASADLEYYVTAAEPRSPLLAYGPKAGPSQTLSSAPDLSDLSEPDKEAWTFGMESCTVPVNNSDFSGLDNTVNYPFGDLYAWLSAPGSNLDFGTQTFEPMNTLNTTASDKNPWPSIAPGPEFDGGNGLITYESWQSVINVCKNSLSFEFPEEHFKVSDTNIYLDLFFLHFDPLFPIIHRPSLKVRTQYPLLYLSMICIGSAFSSNLAAYRILLGLHRKLRSHLLEVLEAEPAPSTPVLQALLLINYFGRMYGTAKLYDFDQIHHTAVITAAVQSGLLKATDAHWNHFKSLGTAGWALWADAEERVRLAWLAFASESFNAALYRRAPIIQSHDMLTPLPCTNSLWNATDPQGWAQHPENGTQPLNFRMTIRSLLDDATIPRDISALGQWALLHGLMSLASSLSSQGYDMFVLAKREQVSSWKATVYRALAYWHQTAVVQLTGKNDPGSLPHFHAGIPICSVSIMMLLADVEAICTFAGARGSDLPVQERQMARTKLEAWAQASDGRQSCWFALELLQWVFRWTGESGVQRVSPTTQWCIYLAAVTIWAFTTLVEERSVDLTRTNLVGPLTRCRVEPTLARRAALDYCSRLLSCEDPVHLPSQPDIGQCISIIAYTAHLCGSVEWGIVADPTRVLYDLLKMVEGRNKSFVSC